MNRSRVPISQKAKFAAGALMMLCFAAPAVAQFEVSPDHFDEQSSSVVTQITPEQQRVQAGITEQKRILDSYYAQIRNKSQEVEAIWQDLIAHGTEAGQDLALSARQKQLDQLRTELAAQIGAAEATLASLEEQKQMVPARAQLKPVPPPARIQPARTQARRQRGTTLQAAL